MTRAAFLVDDDLNNYDALESCLAGCGRKPMDRLADELGALGACTHTQRILLEIRQILREKGAGETENLTRCVPVLNGMLLVQKSPRPLNSPAQHLRLRRSGTLQRRTRLEDDLLKLLRSLHEPALG
ncbi:MAG: hypothetical protein WAM82_18945 [Thermoanaerobaculia bacterium]